MSGLVALVERRTPTEHNATISLNVKVGSASGCGFSWHVELVKMLKDDHGLGRGHANAVVAHTLAEDKA
jgi:C4-dicarboxylate transporter